MYTKEIEEQAKKLVEEKYKEEDKGFDSNMNIELVKTLQDLYPNLIIGGSISLYLRGVKLDRFADGKVDLDVIMPHFILLRTDGTIKVEKIEDRPSGSDYSQTLKVNGNKVDIRIDPFQEYEIITYKGFDFKVVPLHNVIEAKARYASTRWGEKHRADLEEMLIKTINLKEKL